MTREIKFRAWDNGKMHKVGFNNLSENKHHPNGHIYIRNEMKPFGESYATTLMQYTGLKDKNGKEIWEGDVVWDETSEEHCQVVLEEGCFRYTGETTTQNLFERCDLLEVVGNIHDNPELLEGRTEWVK